MQLLSALQVATVLYLRPHCVTHEGVPVELRYMQRESATQRPSPSDTSMDAQPLRHLPPVHVQSLLPRHWLSAETAVQSVLQAPLAHMQPCSVWHSEMVVAAMLQRVVHVSLATFQSQISSSALQGSAVKRRFGFRTDTVSIRGFSAR